MLYVAYFASWEGDAPAEKGTQEIMNVEIETGRMSASRDREGAETNLVSAQHSHC